MKINSTTIIIVVIALLVGAGIGWLAFTTFYADDLATAQSVKEAIGEEYLARGGLKAQLPSIAEKYNLDCRPEIAQAASRAMGTGVRITCRRPTPTPTPVPPLTPTCGNHSAPYDGTLCIGDAIGPIGARNVILKELTTSRALFEIRTLAGHLDISLSVALGSAETFSDGITEITVRVKRVSSWSDGSLTAEVTIAYNFSCVGSETHPLPFSGQMCVGDSVTSGSSAVRLTSLSSTEAHFQVSDTTGTTTYNLTAGESEIHPGLFNITLNRIFFDSSSRLAAGVRVESVCRQHEYVPGVVEETLNVCDSVVDTETGAYIKVISIGPESLPDGPLGAEIEYGFTGATTREHFSEETLNSASSGTTAMFVKVTAITRGIGGTANASIRTAVGPIVEWKPLMLVGDVINSTTPGCYLQLKAADISPSSDPALYPSMIQFQLQYENGTAAHAAEWRNQWDLFGGACLGVAAVNRIYYGTGGVPMADILVIK